jgi:4'-phosphopantetheinyl transferase
VPQTPLTQLTGELPSGQVHVWLAKVDPPGAEILELTHLLNPDEQSRAARFKVNDARNQFIASRASLRMVLAKYLQTVPQQLTFRLGSHGKPELADTPEIHFNLSHTHSLAAIAITRVAAVGVDVERIRENVDPLQLADRYFSKPEAAWVRAHPVSKRAAAFFSCWTAKEAYIKAVGEGLSIPLDGFTIIPDSAKSELQIEIADDPSAARKWTLRRLELSAEFRGAVAVNAADCFIRAGWLPASSPL